MALNIFGKKKVEEAPVEEKKPLSLVQVKVKFEMFSRKCDGYIARFQELADKCLQRATALKLKGLPANIEIQDFARHNARIAGIEKQRSIFRRLIERAEEVEMQTGLIKSLGDMASVIGDIGLDSGEISKLNDEILDKTIKLNEKQNLLESKFDELGAAMDSFDSATAGSLSSIEASINAMIDQSISDARLSADAVSADEIANDVRSKLNVNI